MLKSIFRCAKEKFFSDIKELINDVKQDVPYWYGLNPAAVEDVLNMHKCCLISGEGGIGNFAFSEIMFCMIQGGSVRWQ